MTFHWRSIPTFLRALGRVLVNLFLRAPVLAPKQIIEQREAICAKCPRNVHDQCTVCDCFITAKVCLASEQCPDTPPRWLRVD